MMLKTGVSGHCQRWGCALGLAPPRFPSSRLGVACSGVRVGPLGSNPF